MTWSDQFCSKARGALRAAAPRAAQLLALGPGNPGMNLEQLAKEVGKLLQPAGVPQARSLLDVVYKLAGVPAKPGALRQRAYRRKRHQNG